MPSEAGSLRSPLFMRAEMSIRMECVAPPRRLRTCRARNGALFRSGRVCRRSHCTGVTGACIVSV